MWTSPVTAIARDDSDLKLDKNLKMSPSPS